MYQLTNIFRNEPPVLAGCVQAVLALAVLFGVPLTAEQLAGIEGTLAMLLALLVRHHVTPINGGTP